MAAEENTVLDIGSRLESLVDSCMIARMGGGAELCLHTPVRPEVVLLTGQPWEGNACRNFTIFVEGDIDRMFCRRQYFAVTEEAPEGPKPYRIPSMELEYLLAGDEAFGRCIEALSVQGMGQRHRSRY